MYATSMPKQPSQADDDTRRSDQSTHTTRTSTRTPYQYFDDKDNIARSITNCRLAITPRLQTFASFLESRAKFLLLSTFIRKDHASID